MPVLKPDEIENVNLDYESVAAAGSLQEFHAMLLAGFPKLDASALAGVLAQGMLAANLTGQAEVASGD